MAWLFKRPDEKERGNQAFKDKKLDDAILLYSQGLDNCRGTAQTEQRSKLLANRAAAYVGVGAYAEALADAEEACQINPDWPKAWARKGKALTCLQRHKAAAAAYARGLEAALRELEKKETSHERDVAALKKQASTSSDSYLELLSENEKLRRQLDDFQLMFGEPELGGKSKKG